MDSKKEQLIEEIEQITESVAEKASILEERLSDRYAGVKQTLDKTLSVVTTATKAIAPALIVRAHPWLATGSAIIGGALIARRMVRSHRIRRMERAALPASPVYGPTESAVPMYVATPQTGFLARHSQEIKVVRNLALTALTRIAAKKLSRKLPHLTTQIQIVEESVAGFLR